MVKRRRRKKRRKMRRIKRGGRKGGERRRNTSPENQMYLIKIQVQLCVALTTPAKYRPNSFKAKDVYQMKLLLVTSCRKKLALYCNFPCFWILEQIKKKSLIFFVKMTFDMFGVISYIALQVFELSYNCKYPQSKSLTFI